MNTWRGWCFQHHINIWTMHVIYYSYCYYVVVLLRRLLDCLITAEFFFEEISSLIQSCLNVSCKGHTHISHFKPVLNTTQVQSQHQQRIQSIKARKFQGHTRRNFLLLYELMHNSNHMIGCRLMIMLRLLMPADCRYYCRWAISCKECINKTISLNALFTTTYVYRLC